MSALWQAMTSSDEVKRVAWALLHSLWIGAAVAGLLVMTTFLQRRRSANARYWTACMALMVLVVASAATYFGMPAPISTLASADAMLGLPSDKSATGFADGADSRINAMQNGENAAIFSARPAEPLLNRASRLLEPFSPWIVAAWLGGVAALAAWRMAAWLGVRRMKQSGIKSVNNPLIETVAQLSQAMKIRRPIGVLESAIVKVPTLIGWISPAILLPAGLVSGITPDQLRSIIAHELAHIRRHDYFVNLLQTVVETLFYFHPAVWFISARIRTLREDSCDDMVIAGGADAGDYAESLLCVARRALEIRGLSALPASLALGAVGKPSELRRRVHRVLNGDERRERFAGYWPVAGLIVAALLAGVIVHARISLAAEAKDTALRTDAPKPARWGEEKNGLRSRVIADKQSFHAGEAIPVRLEIENVGKEVREYQTSAAPYNSTLIVLDEHGQPAPYLGGAAQVMVRTEKLEAGKSKELKSFDLADWYYLRKSGRYTVRWPEEIILHGAPDDPMPRPQSTGSAPFEFDVIADAKLANADGDPIAKLLPVMKKRWSLASSDGKPKKLHPGANYAEVTGRFFALEYHPTGYKPDSGLVWLWLADEQAVEQPVTATWPPRSDYLGKVDRWHVYVHADPNARKAWANAEDDIKKVLNGAPAEGPAAAKPAAAGKLEFRLVADEAEKGETEDIPGPDGEEAVRVLKTVALDGRDIERVYAADNNPTPAIGIDFTDAGSKKVERFTRDNIDHRVAIILDGKVLAAPKIRSTISKSLVITGGAKEFTPEKVKSMIDSINAGLKSEKAGE